jgi:hypothetical protein
MMWLTSVPRATKVEEPCTGCQGNFIVESIFFFDELDFLSTNDMLAQETVPDGVRIP